MVSDLYIKFWARFVHPQRDWIELGNTPRVDLNSYMASAYEEVVLPLDFPHLLSGAVGAVSGAGGNQGAL